MTTMVMMKFVGESHTFFFFSRLGKQVWRRGYSGSGHGNPLSKPAGKRGKDGTPLVKQVRIWYHPYPPRTRPVDWPTWRDDR